VNKNAYIDLLMLIIVLSIGLAKPSDAKWHKREYLSINPNSWINLSKTLYWKLLLQAEIGGRFVGHIFLSVKSHYDDNATFHISQMLKLTTEYILGLKLEGINNVLNCK